MTDTAGSPQTAPGHEQAPWSVLVTVPHDIFAEARDDIFEAICEAVLPFEERFDGEIDVSGQPADELAPWTTPGRSVPSSTAPGGHHQGHSPTDTSTVAPASFTADGRRGDWMQTYTGKAFWPLDPRPDEIDPVDVAHALSLLCRYGGHTKRFYSVAEHCVLMSSAVAPQHALAALLHDATEAYLVDLPRPIKRYMPDYKSAEALLWRAVAERFDVDPVLPDEVLEADSRILLTERDALMAPPPRPWGVDHLTPLPVCVEAWSPRDAEVEWLFRLGELTRAAVGGKAGGSDGGDCVRSGEAHA